MDDGPPRDTSRRSLLRASAVALLSPIATGLLTSCGGDSAPGTTPGLEGTPGPGTTAPDATPSPTTSSSATSSPATSSPATRNPATSNPGACEVLVLHHAQGLTQGVRAFAATLRKAGHTVHTPDLYDGRTFTSLDAGLAYANQLGIDVVTERGVRAAAALPHHVVYLGFSLGVLPAQKLAQTRADARGVVLLEACAPASEFGTAWPADVPVQVHGMSDDPHFAGEGDLDAARELLKQSNDGELFVYPGNRHLFTDSSLPSYDAAAAALVTRRVLGFLARH